MTNDIVTRLRSAARSGDLPLGVAFDCDAVADEIERLRAALDAEGNEANLLMLEIRRLRLERDKWRESAESYERGAMSKGDSLITQARQLTEAP